jgi:hypothetical protein
VLGISLSNQKHYVPVNPVSYGGPDNWAAATNMAALIEGLAGVKDSPLTQAYDQPIISPRWNETKTDTVNVTIRYAPSNGYVAYSYINQPNQNRIQLVVTSGAEKINHHILIPQNKKPKSVILGGKPVPFTTSLVEQSHYVDFTVEQQAAHEIIVQY